MSARPITFLSDYGLSDEFVGVVHGVIAEICPDAAVIDISHGVPRQDVRAGALMLAQAGTLILDTFVTRPGVGFPAHMLDLPLTGEGRDDPEDVEKIDVAHAPHSHHGEALHAHEAPIGMLLGPVTLAALSLLITLAPLPLTAGLLAQAAAAAYGSTAKVSLDLFHGINLPLIMSAMAIAFQGCASARFTVA